MQQAIEILEDILSTTVVSKYARSSECMAARDILKLAISEIKEANSLRADGEDYFKHQKQLLERE